MALEKEKFVNYTLEEEKKDKSKTISVKLNKKEQRWLESMKPILQQDKEATLLKQLARVGTKVILDSSEGKFFQTVLENMRKNKRWGIIEIE